MAVAVVQEWPATNRETTGFDAVSAEIRRRIGGAPAGLAFQCAGFDADTFRVFSVWESVVDFERFLEDVIMPAVRAAAPPGGAEPQTHWYELHAVMAPEAHRAGAGP
jgi:hypothetical protein